MKKYYIALSILFLPFFHYIHTMDTVHLFTNNMETLKGHVQKKLDEYFPISSCISSLHAISKVIDDNRVQVTSVYKEFKTLDLSDLLGYLSGSSKRTFNDGMFDVMCEKLTN